MAETGPEGVDRRKATDQADLLAAAAQLQTVTAELNSNFEGVKAFSKETRRIASDTERTNDKLKWVVVVLVVLVIVLTVLVGLVKRSLDKANGALKEIRVTNSVVEQVSRSRAAACALGNEERKLDKKFFADLALNDLESAKAEGYKLTEADKKEIKNFRALVDKRYKPRDCAAIAKEAEPLRDDPEESPVPTGTP